MGLTPSDGNATNLSVLDFEPPAAWGSLSYKGEDAWQPLPPGTFGYFLRSAGPSAAPAWVPATGLGDMLASTYDPLGRMVDAFDLANMSHVGEQAGDLTVKSTVMGWQRIPVGTAGWLLISNGPGTLPTWQVFPGMTAAVYDPTAIVGDAFDLALQHLGSQTTGDLLVFGGASWGRLAPTGTGEVLLSNGVGVVPTFGPIPILTASIDGLALSWTTVAQATIAAGACRDSTDAYTLVVAAPLVADLTVSGVGGLDTGAEAPSTWYAALVIGDSTGSNPPVGLLTVTPGGPTLPVGYDLWRRVGWVRNDPSSDLMKFVQRVNGRSRWVLYDADLQDITPTAGVSSGTWTAAPLTTLVPPTSDMVDLLLGLEQDTLAHSARLRPTGSTVSEIQAYLMFQVNDDGTGTGRATQRFGRVPTDASQSIDWATTGTTTLNISVLGYQDEV